MCRCNYSILSDCLIVSLGEVFLFVSFLLMLTEGEVVVVQHVSCFLYLHGCGESEAEVHVDVPLAALKDGREC